MKEIIRFDLDQMLDVMEQAPEDLSNNTVDERNSIMDVGNITNGSHYPYSNPPIWPTWDWDYTTYTVPVSPWTCYGNVHVFGCDHATKCACGKSTRQPEQPPKCVHCGQSHD